MTFGGTVGMREELGSILYRWIVCCNSNTRCHPNSWIWTSLIGCMIFCPSFRRIYTSQDLRWRISCFPSENFLMLTWNTAILLGDVELGSAGPFPTRKFKDGPDLRRTLGTPHQCERHTTHSLGGYSHQEPGVASAQFFIG